MQEKNTEKKSFYKRRQYIIDKKFQFKYLFYILTMMISTVLIVSFTIFFIIWDKIIKEFFYIPDAAKKLSDIFISTSQILIIPVAILLVIFSMISILLSHKIAGPIYRVRKIAEELKKGNLNIQVRFRKDDELHNLADALNNMIFGIKNLIAMDKKIIDNLVLVVTKLQNDIKNSKGLKKDVKFTIKKLNVIVIKLKKAIEKFKF
ncbi:MAG: HAMP domain-containing protein [Candidatus Goldbacteria bacterium]|nr:HAMP domain-containing protein [Candidatus Goldiibacteriota bacterium]